ncbi:hypothetical protein B0A55_07080 [Friedmanniomyces simplex]|uniref:Uncharacterized protein n=1 Tax=Friedmanniomyces simplex TaxID=329884 RepID=A0A4V5NF11_9PEZI|nr:hypothetical protein B0A55_07080 [Friedmanniomyces simplex]
MSSRTRLTFPITLSTTPSPNNTLQIHITDPRSTTANNLALATWGSSEVLANLLHLLPIPDFSGSGPGTNTFPILELGAGTGLVGLSAAAIWQSWACLTDLPPILPNLEANIALNRDTLTQHGGSAACGVLDWSDPATPILESSTPPTTPSPSRARVILAADTVYSEDHPALLTQAVMARLEKAEPARLVLCYPLRIGYLDHIRELWRLLEEEAGLVCVREGRERLDESWEEETPYEWLETRQADGDNIGNTYQGSAAQ